jgi:hypothetical protein
VSLGAPYGFGQSSNTFFAILAFFGGAGAREDAPSLQYTFLAVTAFPTLIRNHQ